MKTVALYGGSFNPSTDAHRDIGLLLLRQLPVDEVWYLISPQNPFKAKEGMASFEHRVSMARINLAGHDRLIVQEIEAKYVLGRPKGFIETADTLRNLARDFKEHRFIWTMGADNFATFHSWGAGAHYIAENYPLAVIPRESHTEAALNSPSAQRIPRLEAAKDMRTANGWYMLNVVANNINATLCRKHLEQGNVPACMRPEVAHYALKQSIYAPAFTIDGNL